MCIPHSKLKTKRPKPKPTPVKEEKHSWLATGKGILNNLGHATAPAVAADIPPDNIFVPIRPDKILSQIPIGNHHPMPRTGVMDDNKRTMHTNKFYANAFLGKQNEAIWTHPYSLFWGKDHEGEGVVKTWGMCVSHVEENELAFGPGDPSSVSVLW
jgi:endo-1,3(4)-beta-glucanase